MNGGVIGLCLYSVCMLELLIWTLGLLILVGFITVNLKALMASTLHTGIYTMCPQGPTIHK